MLISEKITILLALWILLSLFITGEAGLEIFSILILIGVMVIKELTYRFTGSRFKLKMNALLAVLIVIFVVIIGERIINSGI